LRKARPDIGLSSDFIVGFPGETDQDFADTIDLVKQVGFTQCYSFKYSPRPGTPSADAKNQVPEDVKEYRLAVLQQLLSEQQVAFNQQFEGKKIKVLFEKESPKSLKNNLVNSQNLSDEIESKSKNLIQLWGKSPWLQSVVVEVSQDQAKQYLNQIIEVDVVKARPSSLVAKITNN